MDGVSPFVGLEHKVNQVIRTKELLAPGERIMVAVSGGPDSVALLRCLMALRARWQWDLAIGHVEHGLRGAESEGDAHFVKEMAEKLGVPALVRRLHLKKKHAKLQKQSFQEYARIQRYLALEAMAREWHATKLALGHTADDQAETVILWLLRGCGTGGLGGMPPKRGSSVVRPLLDIQRNEIMDYLYERQESFRVDQSNFQPVYLRNRIRQDLIPQLKTYSHGVVKVLTRQAHIVRDDHTYLEELAREAFLRTCACEKKGEHQFDRLALLAVPLSIRRRVIRRSCRQFLGSGKSPRFDVVERVLDRLAHGQSGWMLIHDGIRISQEYNRLVIQDHVEGHVGVTGSCSKVAVPLAIPGEVLWFPTGQRLRVSEPSPFRMKSSENLSEIHLDPKTFTHELMVRSWVPGDVFCPKGLGGRKKKLQDFFTDLKLPRSQRSKVPLIVAPEGILWVGGLRADERFHSSPSATTVMVATLG